MNQRKSSFSIEAQESSGIGTSFCNTTVQAHGEDHSQDLQEIQNMSSFKPISILKEVSNTLLGFMHVSSSFPRDGSSGRVGEFKAWVQLTPCTGLSGLVS